MRATCHTTLVGAPVSAQASAAELNAAQAELGEIRPILIAHAKCHTESVQLHTKVCAQMVGLNGGMMHSHSRIWGRIQD